jgi:hypothetical protein
MLEYAHADPLATGTALAQGSRKFRNTLLKLVAAIAGLVIGVGSLAVVLFWVSTRPKPWNPSAVTAKFKKLVIYENRNKPDPHYYVNIYFDVTNNTGVRLCLRG